MRIIGLRIQNYRSIEDLGLKFPYFYTAICGKNDAGKSNILRMLRNVFRGPERAFWPAEQGVTLKDDFTKWKDRDKNSDSKFIQVDLTLEIKRADDEGLYRFLQDYLGLLTVGEDASRDICLELMIRYRGEPSLPEVGVRVSDQVLEALKSQEVLKKIQSSFAVLFHDSTEFFHPYRFLESTGMFQEMSSAEAEKIAQARAGLDKALTKIAKRNQEDLTQVLGRLKDKYKIGLSVDRTDTAQVPYNITLGTDDLNVELEKWGSGTQNRTRILMTLFKAKRVRESATSPTKVTPVIVIEEPESYLHPSAQAEFGSILRDLANEFKVQVVVATHSPYLLSLEMPEANVLLERCVVRKRPRQTRVADTAQDQWMEPFSLALGISGRELAPWRDALFTTKDTVILVEGEIDKEYVELLRSDKHGEYALKFDGVVFPYGGKDTLRQKQLLTFIKSRFKRFVVTYDLDVEGEVEQHLKDMGLVRGADYMPIGRDIAGKKCIEGLVPDSVFQSVWSANVELVQKMSAGNASEQRSAKGSLKKLYLSEFQRAVTPGADGYKAFYQLAKQLTRMVQP